MSPPVKCLMRLSTSNPISPCTGDTLRHTSQPPLPSLLLHPPNMTIAGLGPVDETFDRTITKTPLKPVTDASKPYAANEYPPEFVVDYTNKKHIDQFAQVLNAPPTAPDVFISAESDWKPIRQRVGRRKRRPRRDETREGFSYALFSWPLLLLVFGWILFLGFLYFLTRIYIWLYEHFITHTGKRQRLRLALRHSRNYEEWKVAAQQLDAYLGADEWREVEEFSYYDYTTVRRVLSELQELRARASRDDDAIDGLATLVRACVKSDFAGIENPRLYSQTYYGTKTLLQDYYDELERCLRILVDTDQLNLDEKRKLFKHLSKNLGRSALCLSGGACFAYYHFGVVRAHLDAGVIPNIITGTSGGGLVAALVGTRTDDELKIVIRPELADKITACHDGMAVWMARWWKTGARFDSVDWAARALWFTRGSMTFREAYERTGRTLNISCVPSNPNSPSILLNHITAPDCVIWTALLASAAVPGILNPVVLMMKTKDDDLIPYSFGHKWKDGSIRTDIPIQALNLHFNVNFPIVSQVNPHITLFFFSSRGTVGRPVSHRKGRGWRGGFLGSAAEQYLKLDLNKWLKVMRHLELLPRPLGTDWSNLFLQRFYGRVNILPRTKLIDYYYILSDPSRSRLSWMINSGEHATFPKLQFISNRMKIEQLIEEGRRRHKGQGAELEAILSAEDIASLIKKRRDATTGAGSKRSSRRISTDLATIMGTAASAAGGGGTGLGIRDTGGDTSLNTAQPTLEVSGSNSPSTPTLQRFSWFKNSLWPGSIGDVLTATPRDFRDSNRRSTASLRTAVSRNDSLETVLPADNSHNHNTGSGTVGNGFLSPAPPADAMYMSDDERGRYFGAAGGEFGGGEDFTSAANTEDSASASEGDFFSGSEVERGADDDHDDEDDEETEDEGLEMGGGTIRRRGFTGGNEDRAGGTPGRVEFLSAGAV
ncbi:LOW QUALITY PROTEIN: hypothetical protein Dda_3653 [Drechslerella dactyloides]|uniref:PNPLA domain-containing protein n=1 Tax=Drechslerella dactyloides TaxID=74499 RepID=A0AAD6IYC1_DREDA|nr:LOW QUALITY PROTEIN: hypothetical protein Dda_3653 [Drechslerella dactyloides]